MVLACVVVVHIVKGVDLLGHGIELLWRYGQRANIAEPPAPHPENAPRCDPVRPTAVARRSVFSLPEAEQPSELAMASKGREQSGNRAASR